MTIEYKVRENIAVGMIAEKLSTSYRIADTPELRREIKNELRYNHSQSNPAELLGQLEGAVVARAECIAERLKQK